MKKVKCLICGAVFDASLTTCPVCGVGPEYFVPVEEEAPAAGNDSNQDYVVAGGGIAGLSAVQAIRERDKTGSVTLITDESVPTYQRPMLTKTLADPVAVEDLLTVPLSWYEEQNVHLVLGQSVTWIDSAKQTVQTEEGETFPYSKLILATGADCFVPGMPGVEKEGVMVIRRLSDVEAIREKLPDVRHVVVIGGGVLGLEAAWALHQAGKDVTVLERGERVMNRQLDETGSRLLQEAASQCGVVIETSVSTSRIVGDRAVSGVEDTKGHLYPAELVIISAGIRTNLDLAIGAGLTVDRGITVNPKMETSLEHVYACGDCAECEGVKLGLWPEAQEQGRIAGANAAGEELRYERTPVGVSFLGMGTKLFAIGDVGGTPGASYERRGAGVKADGSYECFYYRDGALCGGVLVGDTGRSMSLQKELTEKH